MYDTLEPYKRILELVIIPGISDQPFKASGGHDELASEPDKRTDDTE